MAGGGKSLIPLLNKFIKTIGETGGLDVALQGCKVVSASPGQCTLSLVVEEAHANR